MFKNYIVAAVAFLIGVGAIVFIVHYYNSLEDQECKVSYVFNSATIQKKLIGKKLDYISDHYLPPTSTKKKAGKGNIEAHYDDVKVFTRKEKTYIRQMDITFQDSVAVAINYGEPVKSWDARLANFSPLSFALINAEFMTKDRNPAENKKANTTEAIMLLFFLFILCNLPLLLSWPLATFLVRTLPWKLTLIIDIIWVLLYWLYIGFAAYAIGTAALIGIIGIIGLFIAMRLLDKTVLSDLPDPTLHPSSSGAGNGSGSGGGSHDNDDPTRLPEYTRHIQNLAVIVSLASYAKNVSQERADFLAKVAMKEEIDIDSFNNALKNPTMTVSNASNRARREEFMDNIIKILLCDSSYSTVQLGAVITMEKSYGLEGDAFDQRMAHIAKTCYNRSLSDYKMIKSN